MECSWPPVPRNAIRLTSRPRSSCERFAQRVHRHAAPKLASTHARNAMGFTSRRTVKAPGTSGRSVQCRSSTLPQSAHSLRATRRAVTAAAASSAATREDRQRERAARWQASMHAVRVMRSCRSRDLPRETGVLQSTPTSLSRRSPRQRQSRPGALRACADDGRLRPRGQGPRTL
jgi:hypothetical protein